MIKQITEAHQQAMVRWKQGHQVFHVILVCMNTLLEESKSALEQNNFLKLQSILEQLTVLYDSATVSMKYTADFPPKYYEEMIRPSMMPPFLSPGFSGTQNKDHQQMIEGLGQLQKQMLNKLGDKNKWPDNVLQAWNSLSKSQIRNRKHHGLVCQNHVPEGASLLKQFYQNNK